MITLTSLLSNFGLTMLCLAFIFIIIHLIISKGRISIYEIIYRWTALFALGFTGIYTFVLHAFFPEVTATSIGWAPSPFQYEVAMADLAFGLLGILSFRAHYSFRLATVIGAAFWLWGDATGHIYQIIENQNYASGNAGSWFWMDIIIPLILGTCLVKLTNSKSPLSLK